MHIALIILTILAIVLMITFIIYLIVKPENNFFEFFIDILLIEESLELLGALLSAIAELFNA